MVSSYIPHGFDCDFDLMLSSDGEWQLEEHDLPFMEAVAAREHTHLVLVIDCEGAPFCIAPLPIARWIIRVMNKEYDHLQNKPVEEARAMFAKDWSGSLCIENPRGTGE